MRLFTIGFTQTTAQRFFERLQSAGVRKVIDTRLNNVSQLAGFAKRDDLAYFVKTILGIEYVHLLLLAPDESMLDDYKKKKIDWSQYETLYRALLIRRGVEEKLKAADMDGSCLLCSEAKAERCHRRLAVEYLKEKWSDIGIIHL